MTRPTKSAGADLGVVIDTLTADLGERMRCRTPWSVVAFDGGDERADDLAAIRGYVRAIRVLRAACSGEEER